MHASSWLLMPSIGQMVLMDPPHYQARPGQADRLVDSSVPGSQSGRPKRGDKVPHGELLHQEPCHASPRVDRGEDEQRLEHDGEVIPVGDERLQARQSGEDFWLIPTARDTAPPARPTSFSPICCDSSGRWSIDNPSAANLSGGALMAK